MNDRLSIYDPMVSKKDLPAGPVAVRLGSVYSEEDSCMPKITLIEFNGQDHTIDAAAGKSLMQNAIDRWERDAW